MYIIHDESLISLRGQNVYLSRRSFSFYIHKHLHHTAWKVFKKILPLLLPNRGNLKHLWFSCSVVDVYRNWCRTLNDVKCIWIYYRFGKCAGKKVILISFIYHCKHEEPDVFRHAKDWTVFGYFLAAWTGGWTPAGTLYEIYSILLLIWSENQYMWWYYINITSAKFFHWSKIIHDSYYWILCRNYA